MRKVGNILLLVSGILSIVGCVSSIVGSVLLFVFSSPAFTNTIIAWIQNGTIHSSFPGTPEQVAMAIQTMFLSFAIVLAVEILVAVGCSVVCFLAYSKQKHSLYIAAIALGALNGSATAIVGGIFGVITKDKKSE